MSFRDIPEMERKWSAPSLDCKPVPPGLPRPPSAPRSTRPSVRTRDHGLLLARSGTSTPDIDSDDSGRAPSEDIVSLEEQVEKLKLKLAEERRHRLQAEKLLISANAHKWAPGFGPQPSIADCTETCSPAPSVTTATTTHSAQRFPAKFPLSAASRMV
jgi:hypothetical protein